MSGRWLRKIKFFIDFKNFSDKIYFVNRRQLVRGQAEIRCIQARMHKAVLQVLF